MSPMPRSLLLLLLCALALVGCGGGGGSEAATPTLTKDAVAELLSRGFAGLGNLATQGGGAGKAKRHELPRFNGKPLPKFGAQKANRARAEDGLPYFNEEIQLWTVDFMEGDPGGDHTWGSRFYEDEALTRPAGSDATHSVWNAYPLTDDQVVEITAGPFAGLHFEEHMVFEETGAGRQWGSGHYPNEFDYEYSMTWPAEGYASFTEKFTYPDGIWIQYENAANEQGANDYTVTTSAGVTMALKFGPSYEGTGTITGPSPALPATLEWDMDGNGTIRWSDGTESTFESWSF